MPTGYHSFRGEVTSGPLRLCALARRSILIDMSQQGHHLRRMQTEAESPSVVAVLEEVFGTVWPMIVPV